MPTATPTASVSARGLTYAAYISFVPIGIATVLLGPMLPSLSARWSLDYAEAGALFPVQYIAATCGVGISGIVVARWGFRFPINLGLSLMALGLAFLLSGPKLVGIVCIGIYGLGLGLSVPAANLLVAAANPERRSATLNLLNFFWSVGAVTCPFLVAASAKLQHMPLFLLFVSGFSIVVVVLIVLLGRNIVEPSSNADKTPLLSVIRARAYLLSIFGTLFFLYVGVETGFGQWMASYVKNLGNLPTATALATPSFFYASLMIGRLLAPALLRQIDDVRLVQAGLLLACAGMSGLMFSHALISVAASACAAGFGLSSVYPITISLLSREFPSAQIGSGMFVFANVGGGFLPWIVGISSTRFGTLKAGFYVPLIGCLMMYFLYLRKWSPSGAAADHSRD